MAWPQGRAAHNAKCTDQDFMAMITSDGVHGTAKKLGVTASSAFRRRRNIEKRLGVSIAPPTRGGHVKQLDQHPAAIQLGIQDGVILVGSDPHYWPGIHSTAHRAFVRFCERLNPKVVVMNGDAYDGARVSRWPDGSWQDMGAKPSVIQELEATSSAMTEIAKASPKSRHIFPLGNHDARFEMRLLQQVPEYAEVQGTKLKDHIPNWESCWAALVNQDIVIKHRFKSGIHAPHNNTLWSGRTMVTGHLHSLKVMPISDYNGTRFGVDCGTMADPYGPQFFNYTELNPLNWRSGFVVLTLVKGRLLWPEIVHVIGPNEVEFRGEVIRV